MPSTITNVNPFTDIPKAELFRQLNTKEAGEFLGIPFRNMEQLRFNGRGPLYVRVSPRNIRYRLIDLIRFQEKNLRRSTCDELNVGLGAVDGAEL